MGEAQRPAGGAGETCSCSNASSTAAGAKARKPKAHAVDSDDDEPLEMTTVEYVVHCLLGRIPDLRRNVAHMTGMMPWCNGDDLSDPFKLFCGNPQYGHAFLKLHENLDKITVPHWKCTDTGVMVRMPISWDAWVPAFKAIEATGPETPFRFVDFAGKRIPW